MNLKSWNQKQIEEALGKVNRYFFWKENGREARNDDELIIYYITHGGAKHWRKEHETEKPEDLQ